TPENNPDFWTLYYDLDNPIAGSFYKKSETFSQAEINTALGLKALKGGLATQKFKVATPTADDEATTKKYIDDLLNAIDVSAKADKTDKRFLTARLSFNGDSVVINDSVNFNTLIRTATGDFEVTFTEEMDNKNYIVAGSTSDGYTLPRRNINFHSFTTTGFKINTGWLNEASSGKDNYPLNSIFVSGGKN
ncbi:MAG: hypothetical protein DRG78_17290, partial [Epsilonproteobacteria bacterium]